MFLREIVPPNLPFHREFSDIYCCMLCHIWMYEFMSVPYNASAVTDDKRLLKYSFFPETCPMGKSLKKIFRWCNIHRMENTSCCLIWPKGSTSNTEIYRTPSIVSFYIILIVDSSHMTINELFCILFNMEWIRPDDIKLSKRKCPDIYRINGSSLRHLKK